MKLIVYVFIGIIAFIVLMKIFSRKVGYKIDSSNAPHCYVCAKHGHFREMILLNSSSIVNLQTWNKPWSPTQGCFQCAKCGRLTCYTHSDERRVCDCGTTYWIEKVYLQKEYDNC